MRYPRNRKTVQVFIIATITTAILFTAANLLIEKSSTEEIIATINNQNISSSDIEKKLHIIFEGNSKSIRTPEIHKLPKEVLEILIKEVYLEKELTRQAISSGIEEDEDVKKKISDANNIIIREAYLEQLTKETISSEEIHNKYLKLSEDLDGKKEYLISHIVVESEKEAEKLLKDINSAKSKNNKFAELASKYSIDEGSSGNGGQLDYIIEDDMIEEISLIIKTLNDGEISQPIKSKFGWHLVKVDDVRDAQSPPFESVKGNIENQLRQDIINEENSKILDGAEVKILIQLQDTDATDEE